MIGKNDRSQMIAKQPPPDWERDETNRRFHKRMDKIERREIEAKQPPPDWERDEANRRFHKRMDEFEKREIEANSLPAEVGALTWRKILSVAAAMALSILAVLFLLDLHSSDARQTEIKQAFATFWSGTGAPDCGGGACATALAGTTVHARPSVNGMIIRRYDAEESVGLIGQYIYEDTRAVWYQSSKGGWIEGRFFESAPDGLPLVDVPASRID